jgi:hypothetical protein
VWHNNFLPAVDVIPGLPVIAIAGGIGIGPEKPFAAEVDVFLLR